MNKVKITWLGHACFRFEADNWTVVIDPYADGCVDGIGPVRENADAVYCTHGHHDHSAAENVTLSGRTAPADFSVETIEVPHDHHGGTKRGMNLIHIFRFGDLTVIHMGDTGLVPGEEVIEKLRGCDAMLVPIGGFFTVGPEEAAEIVRKSGARVAIPMHYRTDRFGFEVLSTPDAFTALFGDVTELRGPTLVLDKDTPAGIVVLEPALLE